MPLCAAVLQQSKLDSREIVFECSLNALKSYKTRLSSNRGTANIIYSGPK